MKKVKVGMKEWNVDFINSFFPISAVQFLLKVEDKGLRVGYCGAIIDHGFQSKKDRDIAYGTLRKYIEVYTHSKILQSKEAAYNAKTVVETQKKFLKKECK